ncbi:hypothetical protein DXA97_00730 [Clostridium sp. OF09-36]|nr:hypothetical protein DXA97_00730 [Clostridium sp. OF09-36]
MILVLTLNKVRNRNMITKPVFLCGYTSSGKTTVGKELAKQLGVPFFDTDTLLEEQTGQTPQQLFAEKGEACFRDLEHEIARQASCYPPVSSPQAAACWPRNAMESFSPKPAPSFI